MLKLLRMYVKLAVGLLLSVILLVTLRKVIHQTGRMEKNKGLQQVQKLPNSKPLKSQNFTPTLLWWTIDHEKSFHNLDTSILNTACGGKCIFTDNRAHLNSSHAIFFHAWNKDLRAETKVVKGKWKAVPLDVPKTRKPEQFYIYYTVESSARYQIDIDAFRYFFNWTMTYRLDSDFQITYGRFKKKSSKEVKEYKMDSTIKSRLTKHSKVPVAWLVSKCEGVPSDRNRIVDELKKHIRVDIYGKCGQKPCNSNRMACYADLAKNHKFYLAFENSLCIDYVTEKFFTAIEAGMVPVVYGKANYGHRFPPGSFINVDSFASARGLAEYLKFLDENDEEYLRYFNWRKYYRLDNNLDKVGHFCDVCNRVRKEYYSEVSTVLDIGQWLLKPNSVAPVCASPPEEF